MKLTRGIDYEKVLGCYKNKNEGFYNRLRLCKDCFLKNYKEDCEEVIVENKLEKMKIKDIINDD